MSNLKLTPVSSETLTEQQKLEVGKQIRSCTATSAEEAWKQIGEQTRVTRRTFLRMWYAIKSQGPEPQPEAKESVNEPDEPPKEKKSRPAK